MGETGQPLRVAIAARPIATELVNGDAVCLTRREDGSIRLAVIDGLGHGPEAHHVAMTAVATLEAHPDLNPESSLRLCHEALRGSRGAAISIARLDGPPGARRLTFTGVGNVESMLLTDGLLQRPICYRGIVGVSLRTPRSFDFDLTDGWVLAVFSDGMRARFGVTDLQPALADPAAVADRLLAEWSRQSDDATIAILTDDLPS